MKKVFFLLSVCLLLAGCGKEESPRVITSISFDKSEISIKIGDSETLKINLLPSDLPAPAYIWESSNTEVIMVDKGTITGISAGEATVKVTAAELGLTASCKINVNPVQAGRITLNSENQELNIGDDFQLAAAIEPANTTDKSIIWKSSNEKIATVTEEGLVKAIGIGSTVITVTVGEISVTCNIIVEPIHVTGISLSDENVVIEITDQFQVEARLTPENATNKNVLWNSMDEKIAKISENGLITGVGEGQTVVTAKSEDGNHISQVTVVVNLKGIRLTKTDILLAYPMGKEVIHVLYSHNGAVYTGARWSSSNPAIAVVTSDGEGTNSAMIEGRNEGETIITATSADGLKTATCKVTIAKIKVQEISLDHSFLSLLPGESKQLSAFIYPENAYNKKMIWESSNSSVVSVTQDGLLKSYGFGSATITVKSDDGGVSATCKVDVKDITSFMSLSFSGNIVANIGGFMTGDIYSRITNKSSQTVELLSFYIYDGYSHGLLGYSTDPATLGSLSAERSISLGMKFNSVYYPIFIWTFKWNNKEYEIQHQYPNSFGN